MRKFLLATTVVAVALTFSGKVFAQSDPTHFSLRSFVQVQSQTGRSLAADDNAARVADQTTKPASVELGPVGQQLKELTETRLQQYVRRRSSTMPIRASSPPTS